MKSDTPLTQPSSGFDLENTCRDLIALRVKHGADTPIGHRCSNLDVMLRKGAPAANIAKQMRELQALLAAQ
jgi:hypothetical protein